MTITYKINSGNEIHGISSSWTRVPKRKNVTGSLDYQLWALNIWDIPQMEMSEYLILQGLSGMVLTSVDTNDIDDRNTAKNYTSVEIASIKCNHIGLRATGIQVRFRIDI